MTRGWKLHLGDCVSYGKLLKTIPFLFFNILSTVSLLCIVTRSFFHFLQTIHMDSLHINLFFKLKNQNLCSLPQRTHHVSDQPTAFSVVFPDLSLFLGRGKQNCRDHPKYKSNRTGNDTETKCSEHFLIVSEILFAVLTVSEDANITQFSRLFSTFAFGIFQHYPLSFSEFFEQIIEGWAVQLLICNGRYLYASKGNSFHNK